DVSLLVDHPHLSIPPFSPLSCPIPHVQQGDTVCLVTASKLMVLQQMSTRCISSGGSPTSFYPSLLSSLLSNPSRATRRHSMLGHCQ
ncbi:hypothetical protein J4Q44_G00023140, partial [Coregonus suidteri]